MAQFRARHPEKTAELAGFTWSYVEAGRDGPALLLPGTLGTADLFWAQIEALEGEARIVSVTYPACEDAARLVEGIAALLDRIGMAQASVLGTSLGGYLAQLFAHRHPDRIETLFVGNSLVESSPLAERGPSAEAVRALPGEALRQGTSDTIRTWPEPEPAFTALKAILHEQLYERISAEALRARRLALMTAEDVPALPIPQSRIVVIDSDDDPLIPEDIRLAVRRRYPDAARHSFPRGGHFPYLTRPEDYAEVIRRHLHQR